MTPDAIKLLRERLKMSQLEFARALGLTHRSAVAKLEGGVNRAKGATLKVLGQLADQAAEQAARHAPSTPPPRPSRH